MAGLNKAMIIGHLGRDPKETITSNGISIVNFSVATSESWTDKNSGEKQERTEWHRVVAFGKPAESINKYMKKGSQIYIEGRLQTRSWERDGQTHYTTEIVAQNFQFLGSRQDTTGNQTQQQQGTYNAPQQNQNQPNQDQQQQSYGGQNQAQSNDDDITF